MKTAIMHYSVAPIIGGVEAVIEAHAREFAAAGMPVTLIAGKGERQALPAGVEFIKIEEIASSYPAIETATESLNAGCVPEEFEALTGRLVELLRPVLCKFDHVIIHNILTKHFNLPLTAALFRLMDEGCLKHPLAWCHDLTWSSPNSSSKVFPGYPWELLKTSRPEVTYIAISSRRRKEIVETFGCRPEDVPVIPNGVDARILMGLSEEGAALTERMDLWKAGLILLMPVRVTRAKNIELAMQVTAALKELNTDPRLVVTGPPDPHDPAGLDYFASLKSLQSRLGVEKEVRFVFESGPKGADAAFTISQHLVSEMYRVSDAMFMPSHREGFGMPVLEAALLGTPVITTNVPAVQDLKLERVLLFSDSDRPDLIARRMTEWLEARPEHGMRVQMRRKYTWKAIFENNLLPLLSVTPDKKRTHLSENKA